MQDELIAELRATVAEHRAWQQTDETEDYPEEQFSQCSYRDGHDVQHKSPPNLKFGTGTTLQFSTLTETRTTPTRTPQPGQVAGGGQPPRLPVDQRQAGADTGVFARGEVVQLI